MAHTVAFAPEAVLMRLHDQTGRRKYLTPTERRAFLEAARRAEPEVRTFCEALVYGGARVSEVLALTAGQVDLNEGALIFECLKKRCKGVYRAVPVPPNFLATLERVHNLSACGKQQQLWPWSRTTAWRRVTEIMAAAGLAGIYATPKGLRHGFAINAVTSHIPLHLAQRWLGHARLATTAIYADATGPEERMIAARMWADEIELSATISQRVRKGIFVMSNQIRSLLSRSALSCVTAFLRGLATARPAKGLLAGIMAAAIALIPSVAPAQDSKTAPAHHGKATGTAGEPDILTKAGDYSVSHPVISIVILKGQKETQFTGEQIGDKLTEVFKTVYDIPTKVFVTTGGDYTAINFFVKNRLYGPFGLKASLGAAAAVSRDYDARVRPTLTAKPGSGQH